MNGTLLSVVKLMALIFATVTLAFARMGEMFGPGTPLRDQPKLTVSHLQNEGICKQQTTVNQFVLVHRYLIGDHNDQAKLTEAHRLLSTLIADFERHTHSVSAVLRVTRAQIAFWLNKDYSDADVQAARNVIASSTYPSHVKNDVDRILTMLAAGNSHSSEPQVGSRTIGGRLFRILRRAVGRTFGMGG